MEGGGCGGRWRKVEGSFQEGPRRRRRLKTFVSRARGRRSIPRARRRSSHTSTLSSGEIILIKVCRRASDRFAVRQIDYFSPPRIAEPPSASNQASARLRRRRRISFSGRAGRMITHQWARRQCKRTCTWQQHTHALMRLCVG